MKKKIAIILGTRPEAIKLIPVYQAFKKSDIFEPILISTGQHKEMTGQIFDFFGVYPDLDLEIMVPNQTLSALTAKLFLALDEIIIEHRFQYMAVQGDTTTAMVSAISAFYHKIKVLHIEAGLRTYNRFSPFPEEVNRKIISIAADLNFAPTENSGKALKEEKVANVYVVGNTVIDSLLQAKKIIEENETLYIDYFSNVFPEENRKLVLITGHRRESFGEGFENICEALGLLANEYPEMEFVYPVHLNPNVKNVVHKKLADYPNIKLISPLPYDKLVFLMAKAFIILTDSGGIQEEAPTMHVPLIVMRETTERPEGIEAGCAVLTGTNKIKIVEEFRKIATDKSIYRRMSSVANPYGDGKSSERIVRISEDVIGDE